MKCHSNFLDGVGVGDQLESFVETHIIFVVFCACVVVVFVWFGGG